MRRSVSSRAVIQAAGVLAAGSILAALAAPGCIFDWADDCAHDLGYPGCKGVHATSTGGSGAGGTTATGTTGGGGAGGCVDAAACPPVPAGPCFARGTSACVAGKCVVTYVAGPAPSQKYGSCTINMCAADGGFTTLEDDTNVFVNGNPCTNATCSGEVPINTPDAGGACVTLPNMVQGVCVPDPDPASSKDLYVCGACDTATPCTAPYVCAYGFCLPMHCSDNTMDNGETGVDCGGGFCLPCGTAAPGKTNCAASTDCFSGRCVAGGCAAPSCMDGIKNESETDTDCGGPLCPPCAASRIRLSPGDCLSGVCEPPSPDAGSVPDQCQAPTCTDGVQNGNETSVDCGDNGGDAGPPCPPCPADGGA